MPGDNGPPASIASGPKEYNPAATRLPRVGRRQDVDIDSIAGDFYSTSPMIAHIVARSAPNIAAMRTRASRMVRRPLPSFSPAG